MAVIIVLTSLVHLFLLNWKTFLLHMKAAAYRKGKGRFRLSAEVMVGGALAVTIMAAALGQVGPFGWIHETGDRIKEFYRQEQRAGARAHPGDTHREDVAVNRVGNEDQDGRGLGQGQNGRGLGQGQDERGLGQDQDERGLEQGQDERGLEQDQGIRGLGQGQGGRGLGRNRQ